ncbi:alpha-ketoglutarate-dependent dioxygenase alkB homolog 3 [Hemicordylus capensis]|uniref:alpha-ketoglutarate-dependent dioxygenase alkB homolog 3 n=1 Tax=Hemicordylus capensis TaxID=884348 RepID=UPI0023031F83|nr:alpha-ketoglutarate-dependent dioxygenase alkB homolog 3 [Hemicordylus capensis]XP_053139070.1 alpha-ketoglutarate-dependent dioxygenase alkB homolog 3 [Hemicordylus capensis]
MENKRQRARVQGGWAGQVNNKGPSCATSRASSRNQVVAGTSQAQLRKEMQPPPTKRQFVFKAPEEVVRKAPDPIILEKQGIYEISILPSGVSHIHLVPCFIDSKEADWMFEQLLQEIPWRQRTHVRQDLYFEEPRLTAWYGELPYTYSRLTMQANADWHPLLAMLKDRIEDFTKNTFNSLLCNLYRNEKDSVDWHSDDEPPLGRNPVIASLSFGATRVFEMRKKPLPEENGDYTYVQRVRIPLDHGTLLMMEGATQEDWQHRVSKEYHSREARINLTFRTMYPDSTAMNT